MLQQLKSEVTSTYNVRDIWQITKLHKMHATKLGYIKEE